MDGVSFFDSEIPFQEDRIVVVDDNYRILLHNMEEVLWLEEGEIDLFLLSPTGDAAELPLEVYGTLAEHYNPFIDTFIDGALYFFGTCSTGHLILPFPLHEENATHDYKVIGVANVQSRLKRIPIKELTTLLESKPKYTQEFEKHFKHWQEIIEQLLYKLRTLDITRELFPEIPISLTAGNIASISKHSAKEAKEKVLWIHINSGSCSIQGIENIAVSPLTPIIPAIPFLWLKAINDSDLLLASHTEWYLNSAYWKGIFDLHALFLLLHKHLNEQKLINEQAVAKVAVQREKFLMVLSKQMLTSVTEKEFLYKNTFTLQHKLIDPIQTICDFIKVPLIYSPSVRLINMKQTIYELTESSQLCYRQVSLENNWQSNAYGPLLGFLNGHKEAQPIVLLPNNSSNYVEIDPATGKYCSLRPETINNIAKEAFYFYTMLPRKEVITTLEVMSFALDNKWKDLLLIFVTGLLGSLIILLLPNVSKLLFDFIIPNRDTELLKHLIGALVVIVIAGAAFKFVQESTSLRWEGITRFKLMSGIWIRLFDLPLSFFRTLSAGQILQRLDGLENLQQELVRDIAKLGLSSLSCLFFLLLMFMYAPTMAAIVLVISCLNIAAMISFYIMSLAKAKNMLEEHSGLYSFLMSMIFGISKIRTNAVEGFVFARWAQKMTTLKKNYFRLERLKSLSLVLDHCFSYVSILFIFIYIAYYSNTLLTDKVQSISLGSFIAFFFSYLLFSQNLMEFGKALIHTADVIPAWSMCQPIIHQKPESKTGKIHPGVLTGEISIDNASFRFSPFDAPLLQNISINVMPGEVIAIVGRSGIGKSTLLRLLLGFETLEEGAIYLDGQDLAQLDVREVRRQIGVMLQTNQMMGSTIRDSVANGRPVSDEEIIEALKIAEFLDVMKVFPKGLDTVIAVGGVALSGGQKQRLLLARAIVQKPKILLLDEFTGSLDVATEEKIIQNLDRLGATQIIISQRLYALKHVDKIYVLQHGRIAESGTFEDLVFSSGWFSNTLLTHATGIQT